ncbi:hypothetical protein MTR_4g485540 [Medicago truncatula]|uniref:Uncharacterized protein n=1 Tax=Medicago truncatula TaxID=3880 RepID=A0A072UYI9_MEDTR|nr:hypothetical protein MTR_4g485540 [Medicago truncatula]
MERQRILMISVGGGDDKVEKLESKGRIKKFPIWKSEEEEEEEICGHPSNGFEEEIHRNQQKNSKQYEEEK